MTTRHDPDGPAAVITDAAELVLAIDADCPDCGHPERTFTPATGRYGCTRCPYTSEERTA